MFWEQWAPFLKWAKLELGALLRDHQAFDGERASDIADEMAEKVENSFDIDALSRRNDALRELLARCIADPSDDATYMARLKTHLVHRANRYPMRGVLPTPKKPVK